MDADTIFAVASGAGQAAIAVMRLSGPASRAMLAALCGRVPAPRRASFRRLRNAEGAELDQGMVVWLPGPGSYTGEDAAELYLHGGRAVLMGVADALLLASLFIPAIALLMGVAALLLPLPVAPSRTYEHRVNPVSH